MNIVDTYPVIVTPHLKACRQFYIEWLEFEVVFEATWFVYLRAAEMAPAGVAFMLPEHPSEPPGPESFNGKGIFLTFQVADASAEFERLKKQGATFAYPLTDERWGQRRFALRDPAGTWLDIVEHIDPVPGYWDPYFVKES